MCYYKLHICPYPHQDTIRSLIFDPSKTGHWVECDLIKPWGRLSCGNLIVEHPRNLHKTAVELTFEHILATRFNGPEEHEKFAHMKFPLRTIRSGKTSITPLSADEYRLLGEACEWCSLTTKIVGTKARYLHNDFEAKVVELERRMKQHQLLQELRKEIVEKEEELDKLRYAAWKIANSVVEDKSKDGEKENAAIPATETSLTD